MRKFRKVSRVTRGKDRSHNFELLESRRLMAAYIAGNPTAYATIQAAVDAALPNATINVEAGTYSEQVWIDKTLTLRGAQAGVDGRSNLRISQPESILNGALLADGKRTSAIYIAANDITIDGFTVTGQTTLGDSGAGIVIAPSKNGTHVVNNVIQNNVAGLFLSNNSITNPAVIQYNLFRTNNNPGANGGRGIYTNGAISGNGLTNVVIDSNSFIGNRGTTSTTGLEAAVAFEAFNTGVQSNVTITNNTFDGNGKATLFFNTDNITLTGNTVTNTLDKYSGTFRFEGNVHNVLIQNNTMYDNTGPAVAVDSKGVAGDNSGFVVTGNNFYNNSTGYGSKISVAFDDRTYIGVPDVRNNYWGSPSGPGGDGPGTGDKVYSIGNVIPGGQWSVKTGGNALISPWATAPIGSSRAPYFGVANDGAPIQFEDYDHGGQGIAYNDTTSGNSGNKYRTTQRVDIETATDTGGGFDLTNVVAGEWLYYGVNLKQGGTYTLDVRVATSQATGGKFHVEIDGVNVTGTMTVPATGGAQAWQTISAAGINLTAGAHDVKFVFDTNGAGGTIGNFNYFKLTNTTPIPIPATPTNLIAIAPTFAAISLTWADNASDETGYVIERRVGSGSWQRLVVLSANTLSFIDNSVLSQTVYSYRIRAKGIAGDSGNSNVASVTTPAAQQVTYLSDLPFVGIPTNGWGEVRRDFAISGQVLSIHGVTYSKGLGVHAASDMSFYLGGAYKSFLADVGIDDRQLYDGTVTFQVFADGVLAYDSGLVTHADVTKKINLDVTGVQTLRLVVTDGGDGIDFDHADWADARLTLNTVPPPPPPPVVLPPAIPSGLTASAISQTRIDLTWSNVADETAFILERSTDGMNFATVATLNADVLAYSDMTVTASTTYWYRIRATNTGGSSNASNVTTATTPAVAPPPPAPTVPLAPTGLAASAASIAQINLTWTDASSDETAFHIERSINGTTFTQVATVAANVTTFSDSTGLSASTTYFYRVIATSAVGASPASNVAGATTLTAPTPPPSTLPTGWAQNPIGFVGPVPDISYSAGSYSVKGAGAGVGAKADSFQFVYQQLTGDGEIIARVASVQNTSSTAQAGIMMRDSLDAGAKQASVLANASSTYGVSFIRRTSVDGKSSTLSNYVVSTPVWLRLVRKGSTFTAYRSTDGVKWKSIGSQTISMNSTIYVGLAVASKSTMTQGTSTFDNVTLKKN